MSWACLGALLMVLAVVVGDLHYPEPRVREVLMKASSLRPEWLILAGDFLNIPYDNLVGKLLRLIRKAGFRNVAAIMGNHEHYLSKRARSRGASSIEQVKRLEEVLEDHGVRVLGLRGDPLDLGGVYIAGATGWYDYTLAPPGYSLRDFENCNPFGVSLHQLEYCEKGRPWSCPKWWRRDCIYIRLPMSNEEYVKMNVARVRAQLEEAPSGSRKVIIYHHIPRKELALLHGDERDFDLAYAGSIRLLEPVVEYGVETVAYGHLHQWSRSWVQKVEGVTYVNTYPYRDGDVQVLAITREDVELV